MNLGLLNLWNQHDEKIAVKYREDFAAKGWLLSWSLDDAGFWRALISAPELPYPVGREVPGHRPGLLGHGRDSGPTRRPGLLD